MMKTQKRAIIAIPAAIALGLAALVFTNLPRPVTASDSSFDLTQLADGIYPGSCDNGLVKVQVEVAVEDQAISQIQIVKHVNGMGSAAEAITNTVIHMQSVELEAVSGATLSTKTILKAVEDALSRGPESK